jgi:hypothetical protein
LFSTAFPTDKITNFMMDNLDLHFVICPFPGGKRGGDVVNELFTNVRQGAYGHYQM